MNDQDLIDRVAAVIERLHGLHSVDVAKAVIGVVRAEDNALELAVRAVGILIRDWRDSGKGDIPVAEVEETLHNPARVVMKR